PVNDHRDLVDPFIPPGQRSPHALPKCFAFFGDGQVHRVLQLIVCLTATALAHLPSLMHHGHFAFASPPLRAPPSALEIGVKPIHLYEQRFHSPLPFTANGSVVTLALRRLTHLTQRL